ncbi:MAG: tetratricopeptide repeat protein [Acidobacteriota bacterium]
MLVLHSAPVCRLALICVLLAASSSSLAARQELAPALADRFSSGVAAIKAGRLDEAERAFRDVLSQGGNRAFVHHNLGIVLQQRGRHREALVEFRAALALDPAFGPARLLAGTSLLALQQPAAAVVELERAVTLMPGEPAAHLQLADAYERTGNTDGVVAEYRRLTTLAPDSDEYAYRLGKAYLRLAERSYERIRAVNPLSARLAQALGSQYLDQDRPDLARRAFEDAARLDPALAGIHLALARIHLREGRWEDAAAEVAREQAIAPESADARALQADIEAARKKQ